jgi:TPR repeat protein
MKKCSSSMPSSKNKSKSKGQRVGTIDSAKQKLTEHDFALADLPQQVENPLWQEVRTECGLTLKEVLALQNCVATAQPQSPPPSLTPPAPSVLDQEPSTSSLSEVACPAAEFASGRLHDWLADVPDVSVVVSLVGPGACFLDLMSGLLPGQTTLTRTLMEGIVREQRDFIRKLSIKPDVEEEYLVAVRLFTLQEPIPFFSYVNDIMNSDERKGFESIAPFVRLLMKALYALEAAGYGVETQAYRGLKIVDNPTLSHKYDNYKTELTVGSLVTFSGFTSVSVVDTASEEFGDALFYHFLKIRGVNISSLSKYPNESELLVMPPGVFRISGVYMLSGKLIVTVSQEETANERYLAAPAESLVSPCSPAICMDRVQTSTTSAPSAREADEDYFLACNFAGGYGVQKDLCRAARLFERAANQDHAEALCRLGDFYHRGCGVVKDLEKAVKCFRRSAKLGCVNGMVTLGACFALGHGVAKNMPEAVKWTRMAAEKGSKAAQIALANWCSAKLITLKDKSEALKWYRLAASHDDAVAQCALGECLISGNGVERDVGEAVRLFRCAADKGHMIGQHQLAECYKRGKGVAINCEEAMKWHLLSADQGYVPALAAVGAAYATGKGVCRDDSEALKWLLLAAEKGCPEAQMIVSGFYTHGNGCDTNPAESMKWMRRAAESGLKVAQHQLARRYLNSSIGSANMKEAIYWYKKAAEQGCVDSQSELGVLYFSDKCGYQNMKEAVVWLRRAAENGSIMSLHTLVACYWEGQGVKKDPKEAVKWLRRGVKLGCTQSLYKLGQCYAIGLGVSQDRKEALACYRQGADKGNVEAIKALATCYLYGRGVTIDLEEGKKYSLLAAEKGDSDAQRVCTEKGYAKTSDRKRWLRTAAAAGCVNAQCELGQQLMEEEPVEGKEEAVRLFRVAVEQGCLASKVYLGLCYLKGCGVAKSDEEGMRLIRFTANQMYCLGQYQLAVCYATGMGVTQDKSEAVKWYLLAATPRSAAEGNVTVAAPEMFAKIRDLGYYPSIVARARLEAQCKLGFCYLNGFGVEKNKEEAVKWYRLAAESGDAAAVSKLLTLGVGWN